MCVVIGDEIKIIYMKGEPQYECKTGTVTYIDSMGQLHGTWGGLAVQLENDTVEVIEKKEKNKFVYLLSLLFFLHVQICLGRCVCACFFLKKNINILKKLIDLYGRHCNV